MKVKTHRTRVFLVNEAGEILLMTRNFRDVTRVNSPVVLLPGGGIDEGETSMEGLTREVWEELRVNLSRPELIHVHRGTRPTTDSEKRYWPRSTEIENTFDFYRAKVDKDSVRLSSKERKKFDRIDWVMPKDVSYFGYQHNVKIGDGIEEAIAFL